MDPAEVEICTQMPVPPELQGQASMLSIQENILNGHQVTPGDASQVGSPAAMALPVGSMWANGHTIKVRILNGPSAHIKGKIKQYANVWTQYANISFEWVDGGPADIRVRVNADRTSWSYVGTACLAIDQSQPTMNFGWLTDETNEDEYSRVITHEFGHALGCIHEHQSPVAGIPWNREAVYRYYEQTNGWDRTTTDINMFQLYDHSTTQFS